MREFLENFSAGKIGVKYYLVKPLFTKNKRNLIASLVSLLSLILAFRTVMFLDSKDVNGWINTVLFMVIITIPAYTLGKILLRYEKSGKIYFNEDSVLIQADNEQLIQYEDIIKIEYCGGLLKHYLQGGHAGLHFQTYKIRFFTDINKSITIEVTREIFVLPEEKGEFSEIYPVIERTIKAIKPKYGIIENRKLRRA